MNFSAVVKVREYRNGKPNKNGELPVWLTLLAGKMPNRFVVDGTIAKDYELEKGSTYLIDMTETPYDEKFGRQFQLINADLLETFSDKREAREFLGEALVINVDAPEQIAKDAEIIEKELNQEQD